MDQARIKAFLVFVFGLDNLEIELNNILNKHEQLYQNIKQIICDPMYIYNDNSNNLLKDAENFQSIIKLLQQDCKLKNCKACILYNEYLYFDALANYKCICKSEYTSALDNFIEIHPQIEISKKSSLKNYVFTLSSSLSNINLKNKCISCNELNIPETYSYNTPSTLIFCCSYNENSYRGSLQILRSLNSISSDFFNLNDTYTISKIFFIKDNISLILYYEDN